VNFEVLLNESELVAEQAVNMLRKQIGELEKAYRGKRMAADEERERRRRGQPVA
jgi:transcriptional regulator of nitric oxide reductase